MYSADVIPVALVPPPVAADAPLLLLSMALSLLFEANSADEELGDEAAGDAAGSGLPGVPAADAAAVAAAAAAASASAAAAPAAAAAAAEALRAKLASSAMRATAVPSAILILARRSARDVLACTAPSSVHALITSLPSGVSNSSHIAKSAVVSVMAVRCR
jgi:hypothetical protein